MKKIFKKILIIIGIIIGVLALAYGGLFLKVGVTHIEGDFEKDDIIKILDNQRVQIGVDYRGWACAKLNGDNTQADNLKKNKILWIDDHLL